MFATNGFNEVSGMQNIHPDDFLNHHQQMNAGAGAYLAAMTGASMGPMVYGRSILGWDAEEDVQSLSVRVKSSLDWDFTSYLCEVKDDIKNE